MNWDRKSTYAVRSKNILTPAGMVDGAVLINKGKIESVLPREQLDAHCPTYDVGELVLMPGLVDTHVHINEPGRTDWEGYQTATRAAAAGGITCVVDMPLNCIPVTTSLKAFQEKLKAVGAQLSVDCAYYGGVVPGNLDELPAMVRAGIVGFKAFMVHSGIDDFPKAEPHVLAAAMECLGGLQVPLLVHAELDASDGTAIYAEHDLPEPYESFLRSRPASWEVEAIRTVIGLSQAQHCRTHIVHLSAGAAVPEIMAAKKKGIPITVETCPHYLTFAAEEIKAGDTRFKCAPPVRERQNQDQLWQYLREGAIDFVVSDHSPCTPHLKLHERGDFEHAWGGISGLQFGMSAVWSNAGKKGIPLEQVSRWMATGPAALVGLSHRKGRIAPGYDADLVAFDPRKQFRIEENNIFHRHKVTPYSDFDLVGKVEATFVRGQLVYERGAFLGGPTGASMLKGHL